MPAPSAYLDIDTLPFSRTVTQAEFNGGTYGNTTNEVWFRDVGTARRVVGLYCDKGGTFNADIYVYDSDGSTLVNSDTAVTNRAIQVLVPANTVYVKVVAHGGGSSDFDFTFQADERPVDSDVTLTVGQYIVNDDSSATQLSAVLNATTGAVVGFLTYLPAGENANFLPTGESLWHGTDAAHPGVYLHLYDSAVQYVTSVDPGFTAASIPINGAGSTFYFVKPSTYQLFRMTPSGTVTAMGFLPGFSSVSALGANVEGTILYWTDDVGVAEVHRYDLVNDTALSDLLTVSGFDTNNDIMGLTGLSEPGDIIVQPDGSVVFWYFDDSATAYILMHVSSAGSVLHTYSFPSPTYNSIDHLAKSGDSDYVHIWTFDDSTPKQAHLGKLALADGTISPVFQTDCFKGASGVSANEHPDSAQLFGLSSSCTFFLLQAVSEPTGTPTEIACLHGSFSNVIHGSGSYGGSTTCTHGSYRPSISLSGSV